MPSGGQVSGLVLASAGSGGFILPGRSVDSRFDLEHSFNILLRWGPGTTRTRAGRSRRPLEQCAELLGVDLATIREVAANVEPYLRADGTRIWSLMQLERQLRPEVYGRRRGGYLDRRRTP
jgi:hypothetical protein